MRPRPLRFALPLRRVTSGRNGSLLAGGGRKLLPLPQ